jgi:hypothetical protein
MVRSKKLSRLLGAALIVSCAPGVATADTPRLTTVGTIDKQLAVKSDVWLEGPNTLTQNAEPDKVREFSVACCAAEGCSATGYLRLYDLDTEFNLSGRFCVESVDHAVSSSNAVHDVTVNLYCLDDGQAFSVANLTLVGTQTSPRPASSREFFNVDVDGCCDAKTQSIVVELLSNDCAEKDACDPFYAGFNDLGQSGASFILAPDCGITEPTDLAALGFSRFHLVQVVNQVFPTFGVWAFVFAVVVLLTVSTIVLMKRRRSST